MADNEGSDRRACIQALHEAARLERAQTLRRLLQGLLRWRSTAEAWPSQPALGEGG
jgi:hypothetical protein